MCPNGVANCPGPSQPQSAFLCLKCRRSGVKFGGPSAKQGSTAGPGATSMVASTKPVPTINLPPRPPRVPARISEGLRLLLKWVWDESTRLHRPLTQREIYDHYNAVPHGSNPLTMPSWTFLAQLANLAQHEVYVQGLGMKDLSALLGEIASFRPRPERWSATGERGKKFLYHELFQTFFHIYLGSGEVKERIYINCQADHILTVFGFVRQRILTLPGTIGGKCSGPRALERADNIVIYLKDATACKVAVELLIAYADQNRSHFCDTVPLTTKQLKPGLGISTGAEPPSVEPFTNADDRINKLIAEYEDAYQGVLPADPAARRQILLNLMSQEDLKADVFEEQASYGGFRAALIEGCLTDCFGKRDFSDFCHEIEAQFKVVGIDPRNPEVQTERTKTSMMHRGGAVSQNKRAGVK